MSTKSEAQKFLESYEMDKVRMECKLEERQYWHDLSLRITGQMLGDRVQTSGSKDTMAKARDACKEKEQEILSQVLILRDRQTEVTGVLDQLTNPTEYKLLHLRYIQGKQPKEVANIFKSSVDWFSTTQGRAFKSVLQVLENK